MKLTNIQCKSAAPKSKQYKLTDGNGLFLLIMPNGGKYWRMNYRFDGSSKTLSFGVYPEVSLIDAREKRDHARKQIADGIDPSRLKRQEKIIRSVKAGNSFEAITREYYDSKEGVLTRSYIDRTISSFENHVFPYIGSDPIKDITSPELLNILRIIQDKGKVDLAHRTLQRCGQVFRFAIATCRAERDISQDLRGALKTVKKQHLKSLGEDELPDFFDRLEAQSAQPLTKLALKLLILTFTRTIEIRGAKWDEFDLKKRRWQIPAERMKMREKHLVPLSNQSMSILGKIKALELNSEFIFPNVNNPDRMMSENTMLYCLYDMKYRNKATCHGFRSTASTILNEHGFDPDVIEKQLAHEPRNKVRAAYNHAKYMDDRIEMMQWWGDYLEKAGMKVE